MVFFKTVPNLPDMDKARIEHALQRLAECLGIENFLLPYQGLHSMVGVFRILAEPQALETSGGGG